MSKHDHYEYGVRMCQALFLGEENTYPTINEKQFALGIMSVCKSHLNSRPEPGTIIRMTSEETIRKYGKMIPFVVIECLDGSGDVWFEDEMPYLDEHGNDIQSRCLPSECMWI